MKRDRRNEGRAALGRRASERLCDYRLVHWRADHDPVPRCGWLVQWSSNGLALITEKQDTPAAGSRLVPSRRSRGPGFDKPIVVKRTSALSPALDLVAGTYTSGSLSTRSCVHPGGSARDRRSVPRSKTDRRRSPRWPVNKLIHWRVLRGRRIRISQVLERSLDGLVMKVEPEDTPCVGTRFFTFGSLATDSNGFRAAIVRRTESPNDDYRLLFAEIEA